MLDPGADVATMAADEAGQQAETEAREEPPVLTPEEEAERSVQALARAAALDEAEEDGQPPTGTRH